jgi:hypothetical protein
MDAGVGEGVSVDGCKFVCEYGRGRRHKLRRERGLGGLNLHPRKHPQHSSFILEIVVFRYFYLSPFLLRMFLLSTLLISIFL